MLLSAALRSNQVPFVSGTVFRSVVVTTFALALGLSVGTAPSARAVGFSTSFADIAGEGFFDPVLGPQRRAAWQYALDVWAPLIEESYPGESIRIEARMDPLEGNATSAVLGTTRPNGYVDNDIAVFPIALWEHLTGANRSFIDVIATFNSAVDTTEVLTDRDWYYGTNGQAGPDVDFVSVVLHEIAHGLGFASVVHPSGAWQLGLPSAYDRFLMQGSTNGTPFVDMPTPQRLAALTSNDVYWFGPHGVAGNHGLPPKIQAPTTYRAGSSISHLDETVFDLSLMSPFYDAPNHRFSPLELGILADIGWNVVPEPAAAVLLAIGGTIVAIRRRVTVAA